ncbi:MAG: RsmB/NOP family class I SAM-dependent RNA methyltransferase, partial [Sideroxydans sp.]
MLLTEYRLDLTIQAVRAALKMEHPADAVLRHFFQQERIGSNERSLVAETLFGALRHRLFLEHACTLEEKGLASARRITLAYWVKFGGYNLRELKPLLKVKEEEWLGLVKSIEMDKLPLSIQAELPDWIVEKMRAQHSDAEILDIGRSMQQVAPLDLRVNTLLAGRDEVLQALQSEGMDAHATPYSPMGIRLKYKPALNKHALFLTGKFEVQDEGSQLLGLMLSPKRNDMVVDFCAGAGGKTLMLGALMNSQGRLYAWDISEKRLTNLKPRLKRSGLSNVQPQLIAHENDAKVKRLAGKIDRVLVDAPC